MFLGPFETTDYDMFKILKFNRSINLSNLKKIKASLMLKNLLQVHPIIVNADMELIDGQHRLQAARELGIPVWYKIHPGATENEIILLQEAKGWEPKDYCNFYATRGNENYQKLEEFCKKHTMPVGVAFKSFFTFGRCSEFAAAFRSGDFKFPQENAIQELEETMVKIKECVASINKYCFSRKRITKSTYFARALNTLFQVVGFDSNLFLKKIALKADSLRVCGSTGAYYRMFLEIYNFKNSKPIQTVPKKFKE